MRRVMERILNLLAFLLTADRPVTADEIRQTVAGYDQDSDEAFHRMFERDKELLRSMGIPLELRPTDVWEVEFGYSVDPERYRLPEVDLTDEERLALAIASQAVRLGGHTVGPEALMKLGGLGPAGGGEPLGAELGMRAENLSTAFEAATERQVLRFRYRGRSRVLEPYGLLHQRGHWYLIGKEGGEIRAFRMDRADRFEAGEPGAFERPPGFRLQAAVPDEPWAIGDQAVTATVRFDERVAWWAERQLGGSVERAEDGGVVATIEVANPAAFFGWLITFEDSAEILTPEDLRQRFIEQVAP